MCLFIESVRIEDGVIQNVDYHNNRLNSTRAFFWNSHPIDLSNHINIKEKGIWKCRVVYDASIQEITYTLYTLREVNSLRIVHSESIEYTYKSTNRAMLNTLSAQCGAADDILIVKNGLLTDTSIANIALYDGFKWYTPLHPLLKGVRRAELLDKRVIMPRNISLEQLSAYSQITLFNAMIDFGKIVLPINDQRILL